MSKHKIIGILTISLDRLSDDFPPYLDLSERLLELGAQLIVFTPYGINWKQKTVSGLISTKGNWEIGITSWPNAVYNRLYGTHSRFIECLADELGMGMVFNEMNRLDKLEIHHVLTNSKVGEYLPDTVDFSWKNLLFWLTKYKRIILKPKRGHYGKNVYLLVNTEDEYYVFIGSMNNPKYKFDKSGELKKWADETQADLPNQDFLIQKWIESAKFAGRYFDVRLLVQKNNQGNWETTAAVSRIARYNFFISNIVYQIVDSQWLFVQLGWKDLVLIMKDIGLQVGKILCEKLGPFGELSIDFLVDAQANPWIIEINGKPTKTLFTKVVNDNVLSKIYLNPIEYALYLSGIN